MKHQQSKGHRVKNNFYSVALLSSDYWYNPANKQWVYNPRATETIDYIQANLGFFAVPNLHYQYKDYTLQNYVHCSSLRAFRKLLKKLKNVLPKGTEVVLVGKKDHVIAKL